MDDKLRDLVGGHQFTVVARVIRLGATLAPRGCLGRARRGIGQIRGRRTRRVARMLRELGLEVSDLGLEVLELRKHREHNGLDGRGRSLPVRWGNAEGRCKLAHGASMKQSSPRVKGDDPSRPGPSKGCLNGYVHWYEATNIGRKEFKIKHFVD
jgi:hypothetical protein